MDNSFPTHPDADKNNDFRDWYESERRSPEELTNTGWVSEYTMEVNMGYWYVINRTKNFDFYIHTVEDLAVHFAYDGTLQIYVDNDQPMHYKDIEIAIQGYEAMKEVFDMTTEKRNEL